MFDWNVSRVTHLILIILRCVISENNNALLLSNTFVAMHKHWNELQKCDQGGVKKCCT